MAGAYSDTPGRRMAYDDDGCEFAYVSNINNTSVLTPFSTAQKQGMNGENSYVPVSLGSGGVTYDMILLFPEVRDLDGAIGWNSNGGRAVEVWTSADTTTGLDGTWTQRDADVTPTSNRTAVPTNWRTAITSLSYTSLTGMKFRSSGFSPKNQHAYGVIAAGETPDRLLIADRTTGLAFTNDLDFGDVPRGSAEERTLKLVNNSSTLAAQTVQITQESLTGSSSGWYTFAEGGAFQATLQLASNIAASGTANFEIRRNIPVGSTLGIPGASRMQVSVGTWA